MRVCLRNTYSVHHHHLCLLLFIPLIKTALQFLAYSHLVQHLFSLLVILYTATVCPSDHRKTCRNWSCVSLWFLILIFPVRAFPDVASPLDSQAYRLDAVPTNPCPAYSLRPSTDRSRPFDYILLWSRNDCEPIPTYTLRFADPSQSVARNVYATSLLDAYNNEVCYGEDKRLL